MTKTIDARGLTCPAPVLLVKDSVEKEQMAEMMVLVDNEASQENVARFLGSKGYEVQIEKDGSTYRLKASGSGEATAPSQMDNIPENTAHQKIVVMIGADRIGSGDDVLGKKLMINYLKTLKEMGPDLWQLIFINGGVTLTVRSSPVLAQLQEYEKMGTTVLACGTCLEHFGITADKAVGATTNMLDIVTASQLADKVITIG